MIALLGILSPMTALLEYLDRYNDKKQFQNFGWLFFKNIWTFSKWNVFKYSYFKSILPKITYFASILLIAFADLFFSPAKSAHPYK